MDIKQYKELEASFIEYLTQKKLRKTEERFTILKQICVFPGHFDILILHEELAKNNYHVSKATLYNTLDVLLDAGLLVRHQINSQSFQYELRHQADNHIHLVCNKCGSIREIKNQALKADIAQVKTNRFMKKYFSLYIYGICSKCRYNKKKGNRK
ncbi:MAG: transcriptional repressor [Tannerellaceae bacterium]|nr:transcriptional repressor [Tannerellaceae bacterium]